MHYNTTHSHNALHYKSLHPLHSFFYIARFMTTVLESSSQGFTSLRAGRVSRLFNTASRICNLEFVSWKHLQFLNYLRELRLLAIKIPRMYNTCNLVVDKQKIEIYENLNLHFVVQVQKSQKWKDALKVASLKFANLIKKGKLLS